MRRGVGAISRWLALGLFPLLSGCFITSNAPILDRTDIAAGFAPGSYRTLEGLKSDDLAKVPAAERAGCVDPGYVATERDEDFKPTGRAKIVYCAWDPDKGAVKPLSDISVAGTDYHWQSGPDQSNFRLKRIRDDYYLMQAIVVVSGDVKLDAPLYLYLVLRVRPEGVEAYLPDCAQFPSIQTKRTPPAECEVTSAAAMSNDLLAYAARIDSGAEVPVGLFRPAGH